MTSESANPASTPAATRSMDDIVALCRRRGFIWQSSEIYGGINGFWDYGPLGTELKRNLKEAWWHDIVRCPGRGPDGELIDMVGVDCTIIMHPKVWEASGHVAGFNDPMVEDKETHQRFRVDHLYGLYLRWPSERSRSEDLHELVEWMQDSRRQIPHGPNLTCVATGPSEALGMFRAIEKRLKSSITPIDVIGFEAALEFRYKDELCIGFVAQVPAWILKTKPNFVPSPFNATFRGVDPAQSEVSQLMEPRQFNLMFPTYVGAVFDEANRAYLRPETAQGIFCNFWNVVDTSRVKVPFGIAQQGKAFRNEVTPRNFTFRSREFEQMEIEFFIRPDQANEWYRFWRDSRYAWWKSIGLAGDNLQLREHEKEELAHYAKEGAGVCDIEYRFPFTAPGFGELEGVAHRADFDLKAHANACGKGDKMRYFDQERNERYFPHVIEPSAGADRGTLALLCEAYTPDANRPSGVFMKFHPRLAPIKAAIFPLVNKDGMPEIAEKLYMQLRERWAVQIDVKQTIGKRYARMDEAGTPYCFTIDSDTLKDQTVTVRHRDTLQQERLHLDRVAAFLAEKIGG